jgi:hypothetical protein
MALTLAQIGKVINYPLRTETEKNAGIYGFSHISARELI